MASGEGDTNDTFAIAAGKPTLHVILGPVQLPSSSLIRKAVWNFAHPGQRMEVGVCASVGVLFKVHMHLEVTSRSFTLKSLKVTLAPTLLLTTVTHEFTVGLLGPPKI